MIKYSYTEVEDEVIEGKETVKRTAQRTLEHATVEDVVKVIRQFDAKGYDVNISIKAK